MKQIVLPLLLVALATLPLHAQSPVLSIQGLVQKSFGAALEDGTYNLTFKLYTVETGGSPLWSETESVEVTGGVYSHLLGSVTNLTIPFDTTYYLGVTVESGSELLPRARLTSTPYALALIGQSNVFPSTGNVGVGTASPSAGFMVKNNLASQPVLRAQSFDGTERLTILDNGKIGIGYVTPGSSLEVNGGIRARSGPPGIGGVNNNGYAFSGFGENDGGMFSTMNGYVQFYTDYLERMVIDPFGNVSIGGDVGIGGDVDISSKLHVSDSGPQPAMIVESSGTVGTWLSIGNSGGGNWFNLISTGSGNGEGAGKLLFTKGNSASGTTGKFITLDHATEFVGIGTDDPQDKMHIIGRLRISDVPFADYNNLQWQTSTGLVTHDNSSRRFKENITTLKDDWRLILKARPATYTRPGNPDRWELGYIAEEMDSLGLSKLVSYDTACIPDGFNYEKMILYVVEILKDHDEKVAQLEKMEGEVNLLSRDLFLLKLLLAGLALAFFAQLLFKAKLPRPAFFQKKNMPLAAALGASGGSGKAGS